MKRKYYRRKKGIAKKEQPFFKEGSSAIQTKEEKQPFFQTKGTEGLSVGQPGDKYEVEADAMADAVVNNSTKSVAIQSKKISSIQRAVEEEVQTKIQRQGEDEEPIQRKASEAEEVQMQANEEEVQMHAEEEEVQMQSEEEELQTKSEEEEVQMQIDEEEPAIQAKVNGKPKASINLSNRIKLSSGNGQALSPKSKQKMEAAFGADFSGVSIHTNSNAVQMNQKLRSHAFAHGNDIYFNQGKYQPETTTGQHLLAHELTHVVQQNQEITNGIQRSCLPATSCPTNILGSAEGFGAAEDAAELGPRGRRRRMTCARATSTAHTGRARQLEMILLAEDPTLFSRIHGVFIDADMSRGTGAMVTDCASWATTALPSGCTPPSISGATKLCVLVHGRMNKEAYRFNRTSDTVIGGMTREDWRISTVQTLIHEAQHVVFDEATRPQPPGVSASCQRGRIQGELSELHAILSEFPTVFRAVPASGPNRASALSRLNNWFNFAITNPHESIAGTLKAVRCSCDCTDVNAHVRDVFSFVSTSWSASEKTALHTELRNARWNTAAIDLRWPL